jgi:protein-S-isoprenylcysteine O-methyltransferase Ste14
MIPRALGVLLYLAGGCLREWARRHLARHAGLFDVLHVTMPTRRVRSGPYKRLPHPMYLGSLMQFAGAGMVGLGWGGVVLFLPAVPFYGDRIIRENLLVSAADDD